MSSGTERRLRILARLGPRPDTGLAPRRLCEISAEVIGMSGAAIMLVADDVPRGSVCATDRVSALLEDLQFTLGEGPGLDAHQQQAPVLEPDLAAPAAPRWLGFTGPAVAAGARAVFAFPLRFGTVRLGAMHLYRAEPGPLLLDQHADALVMADVAAQALLALQAGAPPGRLAAALEASSDFQHVVHQAAGMVSVQLDVTIALALTRLRAHAFGNDRPLVVVAQDVVSRRLRFDAGTDDQDPHP